MTSKSSNIFFRPLKVNDLLMIYHWFKGKEVNQWYARGKAWSKKNVEDKYLPRIQGLEDISCYIISKDNKDIGFIQYYPLTKSAMPADLTCSMAEKLNIEIEASVGVDMFIGDSSLIGKGLGEGMLKSFIENVIPSQYHTIYLDPEVSNVRAIKSYMKVGFVKFAKQPNDRVCLMCFTRKV